MTKSYYFCVESDRGIGLIHWSGPFKDVYRAWKWYDKNCTYWMIRGRLLILCRGLIPLIAREYYGTTRKEERAIAIEIRDRICLGFRKRPKNYDYSK